MMSRRSSLFTVLLLLTAVAAVSGQTVSGVSFLPGTFYIGDLVEARIIVRDLSLEDTVIPQSLPDQDWILFREVVALRRPDGVELRISFTPLFVGSRTLPPIDVGGIVVDEVAVFVSSILDIEGRELAPMRDQLLLPGTRVILVALLLPGIVLPLVLFVASGYLRRFFTRLRRSLRESLPYRRVVKQLNVLEQEIPELDGKTFYTRLMELVRRFLDQRYSIHVLSSTTAELPHVLAASPIPEDVQETIVDIFQFGDLVKFAGERATIDDRSRHLKEMRHSVTAIHRRRSDRVGS